MQLTVIFTFLVLGLCGLPFGFFSLSGYSLTPHNSQTGIGHGGGSANGDSKPSASPPINQPNSPKTPDASTAGNENSASPDWQVQRTLTGHTKEIHDVAFARNGRLVASASWDNAVSVWDAETGERKQTFQHGYHPHKVLFSPDSNFLYSSGGNGLIKIWNLQTGAGKTLFNAKTDFLRLEMSADGSLIACDCGQKNGVRVLDARTGAIKFSASRDDYIWAVALSPDGKLLAAGGGDKKKLPVIIWNVDTGTIKNTLPADKTREADALAFTPDGNQLVVGSANSAIRFFDVNTGEVNREFTGSGGQTQRIVFSPDNRFVYLVIGGHAQIYDLQANKWLGVLARSVYGLDVSADGKTLVTGNSDDNAVRIWNNFQ